MFISPGASNSSGNLLVSMTLNISADLSWLFTWNTKQSQECLEKVAKTVSFLGHPEGSFLLLLTGEVQKDRALELLNVRPFYFVYLCGVKTQSKPLEP
ncbi:N(6)-adenine-specific DNA methyltransferase 2 [Hordeum vulgare]|nr:N(6)-adenine-specific DNA methyltransferase 2 [Hordeum vulgare]